MGAYSGIGIVVELRFRYDDMSMAHAKPRLGEVSVEPAVCDTVQIWQSSDKPGKVFKLSNSAVLFPRISTQLTSPETVKLGFLSGANTMGLRQFVSSGDFFCSTTRSRKGWPRLIATPVERRE
jgi:hypothetical protein